MSTDIPEVSRLEWCKVARGEEEFVKAVGECLDAQGGEQALHAERLPPLPALGS